MDFTSLRLVDDLADTNTGEEHSLSSRACALISIGYSMMADTRRPSSVPAGVTSISSSSCRAPSPRSLTAKKKTKNRSYHPFKDSAGKRSDSHLQVKKKSSKRSSHSHGELARTWSMSSTSSAATSVAGSAVDHVSLESLDGSDRSLESLILPPLGSKNRSQEDLSCSSDDNKGILAKEQPDDLPQGWLMHYTADGKPYFVNKKERSTTWLDPRTNRPVAATQTPGLAPATVADEWNVPLPQGWEIGVSANGTRYFIDHVNRKTSWTDPRISMLNSSTASSLEDQRQQLRLQQLKLANSEIQLQIEMIKKQQSMLEREMLHSATPETIKLARTKAQADAQNSILSLKAKQQTSYKLQKTRRSGLSTEFQDQGRPYTTTSYSSFGDRRDSTGGSTSSGGSMSSSGIIRHTRHGSMERMSEDSVASFIRGSRDSKRANCLMSDLGTEIKLESGGSAENTLIFLNNDPSPAQLHGDQCELELPELPSPLYDATAGLGLDFDLDILQNGPGLGDDAFLGSWCV